LGIRGAHSLRLAVSKHDRNVRMYVL